MKNTKKRIIEEASKLFIKQGFHGTSVHQIADAVGIAASSLFSHFKSKKDIMQSVYDIFYPDKLFVDAVFFDDFLILNGAYFRNIIKKFNSKYPELSNLECLKFALELQQFKKNRLNAHGQ